MTTLILKTTARVVLPLIVVFSLALFLQGHNLPGGGFIAGVLTAIGMSLVYLAYDIDYIETGILGTEIGSGTEKSPHEATVYRFQTVFGAGIALIAVSGIGAMVLGVPFLSQGYIETDFPLYGHIELASAIIFDFGIYLVVVGALLTIISMVGGSS